MADGGVVQTITDDDPQTTTTHSREITPGGDLATTAAGIEVDIGDNDSVTVRMGQQCPSQRI